MRSSVDTAADRAAVVGPLGRTPQAAATKRIPARVGHSSFTATASWYDAFRQETAA